jgi:hypothetical protein
MPPHRGAGQAPQVRHDDIIFVPAFGQPHITTPMGHGFPHWTKNSGEQREGLFKEVFITEVS